MASELPDTASLENSGLGNIKNSHGNFIFLMSSQEFLFRSDNKLDDGRALLQLEAGPVTLRRKSL